MNNECKKKEYYSKILNNIKGIWDILNCIVKKSSGQQNCPQYFIDSGNINVQNFKKWFDRNKLNLSKTKITITSARYFPIYAVNLKH